MLRSVRPVVVASALSLITVACDRRAAATAELPFELVAEVVRRSPTPEFPDDAGKDLSATVFYADLFLNIDGRVESVRIPANVDTRVARAVQTTVRTWQFPAAALSDGQPVRATTSVRFEIDPTARRVMKGYPSDDRPQPTVTRLAFGQFSVTPSILLIDTRDRLAFRRGHRTGALNMPADELSYRIVDEVSANVTVALDCAVVPQAACEAAAAEFVKRRRSVILLSDDGRTHD